MPEPAPPRDRLLHITDLHFWRVVTNPFRLLNKRFLGNLNVLLRRRHEYAMELAPRYVTALVDTGIRNVLLTGDLTSTAMEEEFASARGFLEMLRSHGLNVILLPGNHDLYTFEAHRKKRFEKYCQDFLPRMPYPVRVELPGGTPLLLVQTACPNLFSTRGRVNREAIEAMAALVDGSPAPALVAAHYPLLSETYGYTLHPLRQLRNAALLRARLGRSRRTLLYVCGHTHRFSYVRDPEFPSLEHLTTGAFLRHDAQSGRLGEFAEIHVFDNGFEVYRHVHEGQWLRHRVTPRSVMDETPAEPSGQGVP
jgi:3',5'-cyclic AMP phosphodiesterase CpdA